LIHEMMQLITRCGHDLSVRPRRYLHEERLIRTNYAGVGVAAAGWLRGVYLTFLRSGYG
jgi:hypothetical protein